VIVRITSKFGEVSTIHPRPHTGIDLAFPEGSPLYSVGSAVVERVVNYGSENIGKGVILRLADGKQAIYGHLSEVKVKAGQSLSEGQLVGLSGNTGHSTGPHLHLGLKNNGEFIDPTPLADRVGEASGGVLNWIAEFPTIGGFIYEKVLGIGIEHWISNYIMALPVLAGVSLGVWGLLSMVSRRLATWGVGFVMIIGAFTII
jgi:hypothetical protein